MSRSQGFQHFSVYILVILRLVRVPQSPSERVLREILCLVGSVISSLALCFMRQVLICSTPFDLISFVCTFASLIVSYLARVHLGFCSLFVASKIERAAKQISTSLLWNLRGKQEIDP